MDKTTLLNWIEREIAALDQLKSEGKIDKVYYLGRKDSLVNVKNKIESDSLSQ